MLGLVVASQAAGNKTVAHRPPPAKARPSITAEAAVRAGSARLFELLLGGKQGCTLSGFAWWHVHKTGTSFANTLLRCACPRLPGDAALDALTTVSLAKGSSGVARPGMLLQAFAAKYPFAAYCSPGFKMSGEHMPVGDATKARGGLPIWDYATHRGRLVTMLREPRLRILSAFATRVQHPSGANASLERMGPEKRAYVRGLTHDLGPDRGDGDARRTALALSRLREGFAFVGLTEQWALSVCLFHKRFGGECVPQEMANLRPTPRPASHAGGSSSGAAGAAGAAGEAGEAGEVPAALAYVRARGHRVSLDDPFFAHVEDDAIYAAAVQRFHAALREAGVDKATCAARVCPRAAGSFARV